MTPDVLGNMTADALRLVLLMSAPLVGSAALIGILFSVLQALTQLQDQTTMLAVKLLVVYGLMIILAPWLGVLSSQFAERLFTAIVEVR
ncbi:MAG: flagellar biosynthetic protein FliQ [Rubrivivax sp.]|nr:flagellar biosynthetic protein FliQ [Rubrivivax sp.]